MNSRFLSIPPGYDDADDKNEPPLEQGNEKENEHADVFALMIVNVELAKIAGQPVK